MAVVMCAVHHPACAVAVDDYNYEKDYLRQAYGHYGYKDDEPEEEPSPKYRHTKHEDDDKGACV